jgi:ribonuclease HI
VDKFLVDLRLSTPHPKERPMKPGLGPKWIPPPPGLFKVNVDATTSKNSPISSFVAVVRDTEGQFMGASLVVVKGVMDSETLEAFAIREGLSITDDLLLHQFQLASDCSNVIRSLTGDGMGYYGHIAQEIKARAARFRCVDFAHESRNSNVDAHSVARSSLPLTLGRHVWLQSPPFGVCMIQNIE